MRGDVPALFGRENWQKMFSPRARGCSLYLTLTNNRIWVFPACAGMFRPHQAPTTLAGRFPRVRGDVPCKAVLAGAAKRFSPRARGCSLVQHILSIRPNVFPACAGMFLMDG